MAQSKELNFNTEIYFLYFIEMEKILLNKGNKS